MRKLAVFVSISVGLWSCATYNPDSLPAGADVITAVPSGKLSMLQIAQLAVTNSPDLLAARQKALVARAQAFEAGLLPDPQLVLSADQPFSNGAGLATAYAFGIAEDLQALLTEPSRAARAAAQQQQAKLDLLWAEWQTIQMAATFFSQKIFADRKTAVLQEVGDLLIAQSMRAQQALAAHNLTIDVAGSDLSAALDVESQINAAQRTALTVSSDLNALIGLAPLLSLTLGQLGEAPEISQPEVYAALATVAQRRPDLLALDAGYHAQEEAVRAAILQQFPAINLGFNRASDTSAIKSTGLSVTLNIPIFGTTQARIQTQRATRAQLRAEYQVRLDRTEADAWRIWISLNLLRAQIQVLDASLPELRRTAQAAQTVYQAGNLAPATYVLLQTSLTTRESELLDLEAALWSDTIALRTLLAMTPLVPAMVMPQ